MRSKNWDTRIAAGQAVHAIASNVKIEASSSDDAGQSQYVNKSITD